MLNQWTHTIDQLTRPANLTGKVTSFAFEGLWPSKGVIGLNAQREQLGDHHCHKKFPERLTFMLDSPIRRVLHPPERLTSQLGIGSRDVVVDFGCGPGFFLIPIARLTGKAIGIDTSPRMLERAARKAKKKHVTVELLQSDGTEIKLADESVDLILLNHVFHEVENKPKVLGEFRRILKLSGRLAIVERTHGTSNFWEIAGPPVIDEKEFTSEIEQGGFALTRKIAYGDSSIAISQKAIG